LIYHFYGLARIQELVLSLLSLGRNDDGLGGMWHHSDYKQHNSYLVYVAAPIGLHLYGLLLQRTGSLPPPPPIYAQQEYPVPDPHGPLPALLVVYKSESCFINN